MDIILQIHCHIFDFKYCILKENLPFLNQRLNLLKSYFLNDQVYYFLNLNLDHHARFQFYPSYQKEIHPIFFKEEPVKILWGYLHFLTLFS